eukprot:g34874.t1
MVGPGDFSSLDLKQWYLKTKDLISKGRILYNGDIRYTKYLNSVDTRPRLKVSFEPRHAATRSHISF